MESPPDDFSVQVIKRFDQQPEAVTVVCLDVDTLGGIAGALEWAKAHPHEGPIFAALRTSYGDMTELSHYISGHLTSPVEDTPEAWRATVYFLWFCIENPDYEDPPSSEPWGVTREEFEEHLRHAARGVSDIDGTTT